MALKEDFEAVVDIRQMKVERIWVLFGVPVGIGEALARGAEVFLQSQSQQYSSSIEIKHSKGKSQR